MKQTLDNNPYESGGFGRCERNKSANRLLERREEYIQNKEHRFFAAANRLQLALSGQSHDIFAIYVYYHQSCYLKFVGAQTFLGILRPHTVIVISFGSVIRAEIHGGM